MIHFILVIIAAVIFLWFFMQRTTTRGQAWAKLLSIAVFALAIIAILFPGSTNSFANFVGVGRGADLLLYLLTLFFLAFLVSQYLHRQDDQEKLIKLARKIAILEANRSSHNEKIIR